MPRGPRLSLDNTIFHIINRGNAREEIFHESKDFEKYLYIIARYKEKFGFKMYHFTLMPNHHHFEWEIDKAEILSKAMQGISLSYSRYHHKKYNGVGYLWQGRFKNMVVEKENYAIRLGAYIENNPKRARLVKDPGEWKWSSYRFYAYGESMKFPFIQANGVRKMVDLIDLDPLYESFGSNLVERQQNYRKFVIGPDSEQDEGQENARRRKEIEFQDGGVLGSEKFKREMASVMEELGVLVKPRKRGRPFKLN